MVVDLIGVVADDLKRSRAKDGLANRRVGFMIEQVFA